MGWKGKGKFKYILKIGLGKNEQGILFPLISQKTSKNYGIIINLNENIKKK